MFSHSSVGRAFHRCRRGHGFQSLWSRGNCSLIVVTKAKNEKQLAIVGYKTVLKSEFTWSLVFKNLSYYFEVVCRNFVPRVFIVVVTERPWERGWVCRWSFHTVTGLRCRCKYKHWHYVCCNLSRLKSLCPRAVSLSHRQTVIIEIEGNNITQKKWRNKTLYFITYLIAEF